MKRDRLWVCERCLLAIESREGPQLTQLHYVDEEDPDVSCCDWCEENGLDKLFEIY